MTRWGLLSAAYFPQPPEMRTLHYSHMTVTGVCITGTMGGGGGGSERLHRILVMSCRVAPLQGPGATCETSQKPRVLLVASVENDSFMLASIYEGLPPK